MSASPPSESESTFVCDCDGRMRSACAGEPFYKEHEGKRFCVLHFPGVEKSAVFTNVLKHKLASMDLDFRGVWFPEELSFKSYEFTKDADFRFACFHSKVTFHSARFDAEADFRDTTFEDEANFGEVSFRAFAYFTRAVFHSQANFSAVFFAARVFFTNAKFLDRIDFTFASFMERAYFQQTTFRAKAYFTYTSFQSYALFSGNLQAQLIGDEASFDFQFARIEKPERVSFHTLPLRPHWFINLDTRKLDFANVDWDRWKDSPREGVRLLESKGISPAHRMLAIVYRHLAVNAEENHRYDEASKFRYMAMDARRLESWLGFAPWKLSWWYWLASGYGERITQAFLVLAGILALSALLYTRVGFVRWEPKLANESDVADAKRDTVGTPLSQPRALAYSAGVMTFQKPEPRPATTAAQTIVLLETILGPVQAALLALAIRRKFMR